jgi:integrase
MTGGMRPSEYLALTWNDVDLGLGTVSVSHTLEWKKGGGSSQIPSGHEAVESSTRRWIRASAKKLAELNEQDFSRLDIVAIFLDGKHFSTDHEIVVALGVTIAGDKIILGIDDRIIGRLRW